MYSYFKGTITEICATNITVEVGNIGYLIKVPNPYSFTLNSNTCVYVHHHIREDAEELFGFATKIEKQMFEKLISVKGLGPKGGLAILAGATPEEIKGAIEEATSNFFVKFPGIGSKLSQQIILDLKGKVNFIEATSKNPIDENLEQVSLALKSLGYTQLEIKNVTKKLKLDEQTSLSDAVKMALKLLRS